MTTRTNGKEELGKRYVYKIIYSIMEKGKEKGEIKQSLSLKYCVDLFMACMTGVYLHWCIYGGEYELEPFAMNIARNLYSIIKA